MLFKILILVPLAVVATLMAIGGAGLIAITSTTRVGVRALFAYWASLPTGVSIVLLRKKYTRSRLFLFAALLFQVMQNVGGSIRYYTGSLQPFTDLPSINITGVLLGVAIFSILLLYSFSGKAASDEDPAETPEVRDILLSLVLPICLYAVLWFFVLPWVPDIIMIPLNFLIFIVIIVTLSVTIYRAPRHQFFDPGMDSGFLISSCILFILSVGLLVMEIFIKSSSWIYSENLSIAAYYLIGLSLEIPFLRRCGFTRRISYLMVIALSALTYLPFTATIAIEAAALQGAEYTFIPASVVIHVGAGFLSAMMAILLYTQTKRSMTRRQVPLVLLYMLWAAVAIVTVLMVVNTSILGEPVISAVVASLLTMPLLLLMARWNRVSVPESGAIPGILLAAAGVFLILAIILGEAVNQTLLLTAPEFIGTKYGEAILLVSNLVIMVFFSISFFRIAERAAGKLNVDMYALGFLSTWIVPNILKSYYTKWTMGWWVSEIIVFVGQLLGPALLGLLYVKTLNEAEESHSRAELFADLLMHDVSNYHQMLLTSIELLGDISGSQAQKERLSIEARNVIALAEQLVTNVRLIGQTEQLNLKSLEPVNLVSLLVESLDDVMRGIGSHSAELQYRPDVRDAIVLGNNLLKYVMLNILYYSIQQAAGKPVVKVDIIGQGSAGESYWQIRFSVPNMIAEQVPFSVDTKRESGQFEGGVLGLMTARIITEALGGQLRIRSIGEKGEAPETEFSVSLPALES